MLDTLEQMQEVARALNDGRRSYGVSPRQLDAALDACAFPSSPRLGRPEVALAAIVLAQADNIRDIAQALADEHADAGNAPLLRGRTCCAPMCLSHLRDVERTPRRPRARRALDALAHRARAFALLMDFAFLVEPERQLLSIGYRVADRAQDPSCYDLLASEARSRASSRSRRAICRCVIGSGWAAC
jgi:cyclic beta-1,2-glucan synthetase